MVHIANHHISPGKKQWTWGNHEFGYAWDRNLTDGDGPYIELMAGVYTDNQPDFSFLAPGETKTFSQFWYPIQKIGPVQQANTEAAVSLSRDGKFARIGLCTTRSFPRRSHSTAQRQHDRPGMDAGPTSRRALSSRCGASRFHCRRDYSRQHCRRPRAHPVHAVLYRTSQRCAAGRN